jgi:hypothetical protein
MVTLPCGIFVNQVVPLAEHLRQANVDSIEAMLIIWLQLAKVRFSAAMNPSHMTALLTVQSLETDLVLSFVGGARSMSND